MFKATNKNIIYRMGKHKNEAHHNG